MIEPLTPESLAELRRLLDAYDATTHDAQGRFMIPAPEYTRVAWRAVVALPALLDALDECDAELRRLSTQAATAERDRQLAWRAMDSARAEKGEAIRERDALAARLEGAEAVIEVQDVHARLVIAEHDEAMRALGKLTAERDAEPDRIAELAAERDALAADRDALRAMLAGRCLSGITHRDEEHRQSVCMLPAEHAPLAHDDCMGCTWTDADHWQPSAVDRVADEVRRIADESQREGWDGPMVRILVGRISAALEGEL